jgi:16S rRNA (guanine966-N2)-methyltransferase
MRVISGKFKNIEILFANEKFDDANATPQKIKKALFSIIGEDLTGKSFLDLYACSGQVGIEALSRDAEMVVLNEIDHKRFLFIKAMVNKLKAESNSLYFNFHSFRCLRYLASKDILFDFIFIDPPYPNKNPNADVYYKIIEEIKKYNILKDGGKLLIQHLSKIIINNDASGYKYSGTNRYAKNALTVFERLVG